MTSYGLIGLIFNVLKCKEGLVLKLGEWIRPFVNHLFDQHWATSLIGRQPHLFNVNHCTLSCLTGR